MSEEVLDTGQQSAGNPNLGPRELENATVVLILGILSIVFCFCYGFLGIILGIVALILSNTAKKAYDANPSLYKESSYKNLNAGRICAIIGLILSSLYFLFILIYFVFVGTLAFTGASANY